MRFDQESNPSPFGLQADTLTPEQHGQGAGQSFTSMEVFSITALIRAKQCGCPHTAGT